MAERVDGVQVVRVADARRWRSFEQLHQSERHPNGTFKNLPIVSKHSASWS